MHTYTYTSHSKFRGGGTRRCAHLIAVRRPPQGIAARPSASPSRRGPAAHAFVRGAERPRHTARADFSGVALLAALSRQHLQCIYGIWRVPRAEAKGLAFKPTHHACMVGSAARATRREHRRHARMHETRTSHRGRWLDLLVIELNRYSPYATGHTTETHQKARVHA